MGEPSSLAATGPGRILGRLQPLAPTTGAGSITPAILLLSVVALLLRLALVLAVPTQPVSDFWSYHQRALNLLHEGVYGAFPGQRDATFPPGYPLMLAGVFSLTPSEDTVQVAKLANAALGALLTLLAGTMASFCWGPRAGVGAALLVAIYPPLLLLSLLVASENLFLPLVLAFLLVVLRAGPPGHTWGAAAGAGALVGAMALVRPIGYLLGVLWLARGLQVRWRSRVVLAELVVVLLAQHVVMLPWAIRNARTFGTFSFLSASGGINLFMGNSDPARGGWYAPEAEMTRLAPDVNVDALNPFERDRLAGRLAREWMAQHPARVLGLWRRKLRILMRGYDDLVHFSLSPSGRSGPPLGGRALPRRHWARDCAQLIARAVRWSSALLLGVGGAVLSALILIFLASPNSAWPGALLVTAALYFPLLTAFFVALPRYRLPFDAIVVVVASGVLAAVLRQCLPESRRLVQSLSRRVTRRRSE